MCLKSNVTHLDIRFLTHSSAGLEKIEAAGRDE